MTATSNEERKHHWDRIYRDKAPDDVSWFQAEPAMSLALLERAGVGEHDSVIDVGGGVSRLVDMLLERGFESATVLDVSAEALRHARKRLGQRAERVGWRVADVLEGDVGGPYDLWHDRAVFHFLTDPDDRQRYAEVLASAVPLGGHVIVATFAWDGPERCSGLPVVRYRPEELEAELRGVEIVEWRREDHVTPHGAEQRFVYCLFCRV